MAVDVDVLALGGFDVGAEVFSSITLASNVAPTVASILLVEQASRTIPMDTASIDGNFIGGPPNGFWMSVIR